MGKNEEVKRDERGTETTRVVSLGKNEEVTRDERGTGQLG